MNNKIEIDVKKILLSLNLDSKYPYPVNGEYLQHPIASGLDSPQPQIQSMMPGVMDEIEN